MRRIGFVIEPEFLDRHWGVRVYVYSLSKVLAHHGWRVEFLVPRLSSANELRWHKLHIEDDALFSDASPSSAGTPAEAWESLRRVACSSQHNGGRPAAGPLPAGLQRPCVMPIGSCLAVEQYDAILITNPWMVRWRDRLPARQVFGLVFDLIPNLFGILSDENKPFAFAHQHEFGFRYYEEHCDRVFAISPATRDAYLELVRARRIAGRGPDVVALPAMAPYYAFGDNGGPQASSRARRIVLAGCFDLRKGIKELPALLNGAADCFDEVVAYGGIRCREADVDTFFRSLRFPRLAWHLGPTASHVRDIFRTSSLLLFPSRFEGLGLPLLEAQLQGCRVATYPVSPMQELSLSGAVMLSEDMAESIARLRAALQEPFDHDALRREALAAFVQPTVETDPLDAAA